MFRLLLAGAIVLAPCLRAENIDGSILIQRRLTRPAVTPSVSIYQRGVVVALGQDEAGKDAQGMDAPGKDAQGKDAPGEDVKGRGGVVSNPEDQFALERSRVVVWVEGSGPSDPVRMTMQQLGRRFLPDLLVLPVGSSVGFPNMDPIFHNVFSLSKPKMFELGNYPKGDSREVRFPKAGIVYVNCHLHPNMTASIVVTPNSWRSKVDRAGRFSLKDLPPGDYTVVAWHKAAGVFRKTVRVEMEHGGRVEFFIPFAPDERVKTAGMR